MRGPSTSSEFAADRVAAAFDALAAGWDRGHGPRSLRSLSFNLRVRLLRRLMGGPPAPRRVLDVGCGTGQYLLSLADQFDMAVGIDIAPGMVERARSHAHRQGLSSRLRFEVLPAGQLPAWQSDPFDTALFLGSLEHLPDPARAIADVAGKLRPGGLLVVLLLHPRHPLGRLAQRRVRQGIIPPLRLFPPATVIGWAKAAGLHHRDIPSAGWQAYHRLSAWTVGRHFLVFERYSQVPASSASHPSEHRHLDLGRDPG